MKAGVAEIEAKTIETIRIFEGDPESQNAFAQPAYIEKVMAKRTGQPMKPEEIRQAVEEFYGKPVSHDVRNEWVREVFSDAISKTNEILDKIKNPEAKS